VASSSTLLGGMCFKGIVHYTADYGSAALNRACELSDTVSWTTQQVNVFFSFFLRKPNKISDCICDDYLDIIDIV